MRLSKNVQLISYFLLPDKIRNLNTFINMLFFTTF